MSSRCTSFAELLSRALDRRAELIASLHAEATDTYRVFHGPVEGVPGLTADRYGDLLLVQSFHASLTNDELQALSGYYAATLPDLALVYNDRSASNSRISNSLDEAQAAVADAPREARELGVRYRIRARHEGQDPWLFLDLRAARRRIMQEVAGKSLLNLFAYTCGVGTAAAKAGARFVVNVDFAESALQVGRENARLNELPIRPRFLHSDVFPVVRQYAGIAQPKTVRGKRMPAFPELAPQPFDLVFLDPPRYARSPFGVVDLVRDYPALFKPALLATAPGGTLICCNNVAQIEREPWLEQLLRSARKAGREVREVEWILPEVDFPSFDGDPPLKMVLLRV